MKSNKSIALSHRLINFLLLFLISSALGQYLKSPQRLSPIAHGKPWTGPSTAQADRSLALSGTTGWQVYENIDSETDAILIPELIVTIETDRDWQANDVPTWFLAIPSDSDDPNGVRDFIVIKGKYLLDSEADGGTAIQKQEIEYYQSRDPVFKTDSTDGQFKFTDDGGVFSTQTAEKDPQRSRASNGLQAKIWSVTHAAFSRKSVSISFQLKGPQLQQKLSIPEIPTKLECMAGIAMILPPKDESNVL